MAKVAYASTSRRAFNKLWRLSGKPMLEAVVPINQWELPAGVRYEPHRDHFVDQFGHEVEVDWRSQPAERLPFLPDRALHNAVLDLAGLSTTEGMNIVLLWSASVQEIITNAWGVAIGDKLYRVDTFETRPAGVESPADIAVTLVNAKS